MCRRLHFPAPGGPPFLFGLQQVHHLPRRQVDRARVSVRVGVGQQKEDVQQARILHLLRHGKSRRIPPRPAVSRTGSTREKPKQFVHASVLTELIDETIK